MSPTKNPRATKYHKGSCTECYRKHRSCNRDWSTDKPCSECLKQAKPPTCIREKGHPQTLLNSDGTACVPNTGVSSAHTDGSNQRRRAGASQRSLGHGTESISASSIKFAADNLPNVFDPSRFKALSEKCHDDLGHEYSSPMLYNVLVLLGHNLGDGKSANLLTRAMGAFGEEWFQPTLATIMAMILLSLYLSGHPPQTSGQLSQPLFTPVAARDLLETAHRRLHSYRNYDRLSDVNVTKIDSLLAIVHGTAAKNRSLKIHCDQMILHEPPQMHPAVIPRGSNHPIHFGLAPSDHVPPGTSLLSLPSRPPAPLSPSHQFAVSGVSYPAVHGPEALPPSHPAGVVHRVVPNNVDVYSYGTGNISPRYTAPILYDPNMLTVAGLGAQPSAPYNPYVPISSPIAGIWPVPSTQQHGLATHHVIGQIAQTKGSYSQAQMGSNLGQLSFNGAYVGQNVAFPQNGSGTAFRQS